MESDPHASAEFGIEPAPSQARTSTEVRDNSNDQGYRAEEHSLGAEQLKLFSNSRRHPADSPMTVQATTPSLEYSGMMPRKPTSPQTIGDFRLGEVAIGDCRKLLHGLPEASIDVIVTSPPYWGQRLSAGTGVEDDPREFLRTLTELFTELRPKLKRDGLLWVNLGDAYNTPVNWRADDHEYSTLGADKTGLPATNSAYTKPRLKRKAFIEPEVPWLSYGNLLALPYRLVTALCDEDYLFRGEIIWRKKNPMPEGRCRRPHRQHESIYLFAITEQHGFRVSPPVGSVWEFPNEKIEGPAHYSRFPLELPRRCIAARGAAGTDIIVLDPFAGSGTTGMAAIAEGCSFVGFEIDCDQAAAANERLAGLRP